ncbi:hypothetical protein TNIN_216361 [Trichonephila inaurata madagascariensis]|uniref:Uncharacterized protein n=1 Tax=Trichonephila inaurata madagascariensis TaxID=2747483 RepID=A0A8X7CLQ6_9ARAC|nr:hypothetical protein TNIN_216361 [Trichonephila inaurata madagascariensis]
MNTLFINKELKEERVTSPTRLPLKLLQVSDFYNSKRDNLSKQTSVLHLSPFEAVATRLHRAKEFKLTPTQRSFSA